MPIGRLPWLSGFWQRQSADVLTRQAELALADGDADSAKALLSRAVRRDADFAPAHFLFGRLAWADQNIPAAIEAAWQAWQSAPDEPRYYDTLWRLMNAVCEDIAPKSLRKAPGSYVADVARGNTLRRAADDVGAQSAYLQAIADHPELPFAHTRLGCLRAAARNLAAADQCFREAHRLRRHRDAAVALDPRRLTALFETEAPAPDFTDLTQLPPQTTVVLVACDEGYLERFGRQFVRSLAANGGTDLAVHLHIINPGTQARRFREDIRQEFPDVILAMTYENTGAGGSPTYCACARFLILPALLDAYRRPVVAMDVDMVVTGPLTDLTAPVRSSDVAAFCADERHVDVWDAVRAACVYVVPTLAGLTFAERVRRYIFWHLQEGAAFWYLDQIALFAVLAYSADQEPGNLTVAKFDPVGLLDGEAAKISPDTRLWSITASLPTAEERMASDMFRDYSGFSNTR